MWTGMAERVKTLRGNAVGVKREEDPRQKAVTEKFREKTIRWRQVGLKEVLFALQGGKMKTL